MSSEEACCTCATLLSSIPPQYDEKTEKPARHERRLSCCGRAICARCMTDNPRFETYCPFCQVSSEPSSLPQGLRDPPAYSPPSSPTLQRFNKTEKLEDQPPAYSANGYTDTSPEKTTEDAPDVLHFVDPSNDSISSLSLRYGVPTSALRRTNGLYSDNLLAARRTVLIPGEFYKGGVSLSPRPIEGEEEEIRKGKVRKWMVACKVAEYDVALLYLKQTDYDLDAAVQAYKEDEQWEKDHPLAKGKNKADSSSRRRRYGTGGSISGQLP
ncbi:hypothetical protein K402DRAFT_412722 [Aulographum hederae CBS 113979]|uniref:LysM domain-containing protein n=1 Tax=Aulographum hederae CBS 113979 TaxID=1176131 RepID=A0A6G1GZD2_9PEZI|nr:hypothetical protein K402DRAFT_412722 [Aulographum hederae CBS 113979]